MIVEHYGDPYSAITQTLGKLSCQNIDPMKRVGIINWWWLNNNESMLDNLKSFVERQDICFFLSEEIFGKFSNIDINDVFTLLNRYNVYYILFSEDNTLSVKPPDSKSFYSPWFYKSPLFVPSTFQPDIFYREKPYAFNLMLGSKKSYRTLSFKCLKNNNKIYSSYLGHPQFKNDSSTFLDDEDIQHNLINQNVEVDKLNTMNQVKRENQQCTISHVVPERIYTNTHFDIVTETFVKNDHNFLTEKTAKPLATGRFFCWYASRALTSYLGRYGFDFTNYLADYDNISNDVDRFDSFLNVVEEISSSQSLLEDIYKKTMQSRKHNMSVYWEGRKTFYNNLYNWMLECIQT